MEKIERATKGHKCPSVARFFLEAGQMQKINEQCGQKIRALREKASLLQRELAQKAGVPVRTIGRIERGEVDVRLGTLQKIANALGVKVRDLL